jgi:hypothetical protein
MSFGFIFSASSYNTLIEPQDAFLLMRYVRAKAGLASSYDLYTYKSLDNDNYSEYISAMSSLGQHAEVFIDSGNYEAGRLHNDSWTRAQHLEIISDLSKNYYYFTFDKQTDFIKQSTAVEETLTSVNDLVALGIPENRIIAIVHTTGAIDHKTHPKLNEIIKSIISESKVRYIAIPERDIGDGILNKLDFVSTLRKDLDELDKSIKLHLLGTGNPISMLLFQGLGVQTFDGLEWCRQSIDFNSALLFHPQQYDFFKMDYSTDIKRVIELLKKTSLPYVLRMALHNACFMTQWDEYMGTEKMKCVDLLKKALPHELCKRITEYVVFNR